MINLEDKKKIQDQQRLDTAREILERIVYFGSAHYSDHVMREVLELVKELSIEYLKYDITE